MSSKNTLSQDEQILIFRYNQNNSTISCPNCQTQVLYHDIYCYNCGTKLTDKKKNRTQKVYPINNKIGLKYGGVCLLRELINNPFLFQDVTYVTSFYKPLKVDDILIHFKPLTTFEVLDYLISEEYIEILEGQEKYKSYFSKCNNDYLSYLLKNNNIEPSLSKEENISTLLNLSEDLLEKITSNFILENRGSNYFEVTSKGKEFVEDNLQCVLYDEIFYDFNLEYYDNEFKQSNNLKDFLIGLLDVSINDSVQELKWQSYSDLLYKYAQVYDYFNDNDKMLYYTLQHVICEFNPYDDNKIKYKIGIQEHLKNRIIYALSESKKDYDEVSIIIRQAYDDLRLPKNFITLEDVELLVEEVLINYELREINKHLISIYGFEKINGDKMNFYNMEEQEKAIKILEQ